jgi:probable rRNA maturation factor
MKTAKRAKSAPQSPRRRRPHLRLDVQYATRSRTLPAADDFERWAHAATRGDAEVTVRIVGEAEGRELNRTYRGKDYATNVLTFVMKGTAQFEGDLALCAPVVAKEARAQRKELFAHYAHLTVHGMLHLQGYEHEDEGEAQAMEKLETRILKRLGFPDPYSA